MPAKKQSLQRLEPLAGVRMEGETPYAVSLCNAYLRQRQPRSQRRLAARIGKREKRNPATILTQIADYSKRFRWVARAEHYDAVRERYLSARAEAILSRGIACVEERVLQLDRLNRLLLEQLHEGALWLEDYKSLGSGDAAQVVRVLRYNSNLVRDVLRTLDDAAAETGGRRRGIDLTVTGLAYLLAETPTFDTPESTTWEDVSDDAGTVKE